MVNKKNKWYVVEQTLNMSVNYRIYRKCYDKNKKNFYFHSRLIHKSKKYTTST